MKYKNIFSNYNHSTNNAIIYTAEKPKIVSDPIDWIILYKKKVSYKTYLKNLNKFYKLENA